MNFLFLSQKKSALLQITKCLLLSKHRLISIYKHCREGMSINIRVHMFRYSKEQDELGLGMMKIHSNSYADVKSKKLSTPDYNINVFICTLPTVHKPSVRAQTEAQWVMCFINKITQSQTALSSV